MSFSACSIVFSILRLKSELKTDIVAANIPLIFVIIKIHIKNISSKVYKYHMKILAVQNRMGIGDTIIFLPFIKALFEKYNSPISLLVKESSKADQYLHQTNYIDKIITLERDKNNNKHKGFIGSFNLIKDLKKENFEKIFIFNSSLRFNLIARLSGISKIYQYPLFQKTDQHIINTPKKFFIDTINLKVTGDPEIQIDKLQFFIIGKVSLIEKLSKGKQIFLNLEFNISFNIICSSLFLPVARKNLQFLVFDIFSITDKNIFDGTLLVGPEPPIPKSIFVSSLLMLNFLIESNIIELSI